MGRIVHLSDHTANDSDKTLDLTPYTNGGVRSSGEIELKYGIVSLSTTATIGNRLFTIQIQDEAGNEVFHLHAGSYQAASLVYHYYLMPGVYRETVSAVAEAGVDGTIQVPFPDDFEWPTNWSIRIYDKNAIDAAADDMLVDVALEIC